MAQMTGLNYKIQEMAHRIRELREIENFTIAEMANKTGVTEQEYIDTYVKNHSGAAAGDAITIDGKQAKHFAKVTEIAPDDKKEEHCITVATSNGFIGINTYGMELSIEDVQKIIASIKVK